MKTRVLPGAMLGIIGGGLHSWLFTVTARQMGYRVAVLSPDADCPAGQIANFSISAPREDVEAVANLARNVAAVTVDLEDFSVEAAEAAARRAPLRPGPRVMQVTQHRGLEKQYLRQRGLPVAPFAEIDSLETLRDALTRLGTPAVLKVAQAGGGGRRQFVIRSSSQAEEAWKAIGRRQSVLEKRLDIHREFAVVVAHSACGEMVTYGPILSMERHGHRDSWVAPADLPKAVTDRAVQLARFIACRLEAIGLLCVELFLTGDGQLLVNQLVPRPHDCGHLTLNGHATSQYEQLVRATCGLPLGPADQLRPAATVSLPGDLCQDGEPDWARVFDVPGTYLHLYDGKRLRPDQSLGHITALAPESRRALSRAVTARDVLRTVRAAGPRAVQVWSSDSVEDARMGSAASAGIGSPGGASVEPPARRIA